MESLSGWSDEDGVVDDRIDLPLGMMRFAVAGKLGIRFGSETSLAEETGLGRLRPASGLVLSARMGEGIVFFLG